MPAGFLRRCTELNIVGSEQRNNAHEKKLLNKFELTQQANITSKIKFPMNEIIFFVILFVAFLLSAMQLQNALFKYSSFLYAYN